MLPSRLWFNKLSRWLCCELNIEKHCLNRKGERLRVTPEWAKLISLAENRVDYVAWQYRLQTHSLRPWRCPQCASVLSRKEREAVVVGI